jgi:hypothetical protein
MLDYLCWALCRANGLSRGSVSLQIRGYIYFVISIVKNREHPLPRNVFMFQGNKDNVTVSGGEDGQFPL